MTSLNSIASNSAGLAVDQHDVAEMQVAVDAANETLPSAFTQRGTMPGLEVVWLRAGESSPAAAGKISGCWAKAGGRTCSSMRHQQRRGRAPIAGAETSAAIQASATSGQPQPLASGGSLSDVRRRHRSAERIGELFIDLAGGGSAGAGRYVVQRLFSSKRRISTAHSTVPVRRSGQAERELARGFAGDCEDAAIDSRRIGSVHRDLGLASPPAFLQRRIVPRKESARRVYSMARSPARKTEAAWVRSV